MDKVNEENMLYSVIIPVYNSENTLKVLIQELVYFFEDKLNIKDDRYEIICIDDKSSDKSFDLLSQLQKSFVALRPYKNVRNLGQQESLIRGMSLAQGQVIVTMDDDLQYKVADIEKLIDGIKGGYDLVYGIEEIKSDAVSIRQIGTSLRLSFFKYNYKHLRDKKVSSFRAFKKSMCLCVIEDRRKFRYISAIMLSHTSNIGNVPIIIGSRIFGKSGYNYFKLLKLYLSLVFYYNRFIPNMIKPKRREDSY